MTKSTSPTALFGVSHLALLLGRACALKDNPVTGLWDEDPLKALQGSLFLGVSAWGSLSQILETQPKTLICSSLPPDDMIKKSALELVINLFEKPKSDHIDPIQCWLTSSENWDSEIPLEITSELPSVKGNLVGSDAAKTKARILLAHVWGKLEIRES